MPEASEVSRATLELLLDLARRARRAADANELAFMVVNESFQLAPYRQAALWMRDGGVRALSGVSSTERNVPFVQWLQAVAVELDHVAAPRAIAASDLSADLQSRWAEWLPTHAVWMPLAAGAATPHASGAILFARDDVWSETEIALLADWMDAWSLAWQLKYRASASSHLSRCIRVLTTGATWRGLPVRLFKALAPARLGATLADLWRIRWRRYTLLAGLALFIPVRLTVLAPGELVPANPAVMRAPLDGVVAEVMVQPNERVKTGTPLFVLEQTVLRSRLAVATQALATAQAEYRQQAQLAVFDRKSKSRLLGLQGSISERQTEADYLTTQLARTTITATRDGIVLFDDPSALIGRPVVTGERLATVADERKVEIEAWLAPGDLIPLPRASAITMYLNTAPLSPVKGTLRYVLFEASQRPDGSYAYRLRATPNDGETAARVGLKGTVKVSGNHVPLVYWVLRRPLALARQYLGV